MSKLKLKICGLGDSNNALEVASLLPDYVGFIFYKKSARYYQGPAIALPKTVQKVGVFVDASLKEILQKIVDHNLNAVQLHGEESAEFCNSLKQQFLKSKKNTTSGSSTKNDGANPEIKIIKAFPVNDAFDFSQLDPYQSSCDFFLFDSKGPLPGGNGYTFNWHLLTDYVLQTPYFLSGGIGPSELHNLYQFLDHPASNFCYGIDVNSKFETAPGIKNLEALTTFKKNLIDLNNER